MIKKKKKKKSNSDFYLYGTQIRKSVQELQSHFSV